MTTTTRWSSPASRRCWSRTTSGRRWSPRPRRPGTPSPRERKPARPGALRRRPAGAGARASAGPPRTGYPAAGSCC
ncbi:hypothetical protein HBB16_11520 [Pseudonocardia sp. MCCB 268]|nr:hypothetical protein [Pseudonocardia cytotoxica]